MGLAHEKKSYLQEKAKLFEIGSVEKHKRIPPARDIQADSNMNDLPGQI